MRLYPRASGRLRLPTRTPGPGNCGGATTGPVGRLLDSGKESEGVAFALDDTHECIIRRVPMSACALSCAALRMACWALEDLHGCGSKVSRAGMHAKWVEALPTGQASRRLFDSINMKLGYLKRRQLIGEARQRDIKGEAEAHGSDGCQVSPVRRRTCSRMSDEHILFRDSVPSCQTHEFDPRVSDRVVAMYTRSMCTVEDMGPMSVQHVRTTHARLGDVSTWNVSGDEGSP
eukprot:905769-Amphidinium_carterae.1